MAGKVVQLEYNPPAEEINAMYKHCSSLQKWALAEVVAKAKKLHDAAYPALAQRVLKMRSSVGALFRLEHLLRTLLWIRDEAPIIIHIPLEADGRMDKLLADTHYRNQFETKMSRGSLDFSEGGSRAGWESNIFNKHYDGAEPFQRPKYGVLNVVKDPHGIQKARQYGTSYIQLKGCRLRTTFADQDTSHSGCVVASCEFYAHVLMRFSDDELRGVLEVANGLRAGHVSDLISVYKEVQIHGEISLAHNIDMLMVSSGAAAVKGMMGKVKRFCAKNSCSYVVLEPLDDEEGADEEEAEVDEDEEGPDSAPDEPLPVPNPPATGPVVDSFSDVPDDGMEDDVDFVYPGVEYDADTQWACGMCTLVNPLTLRKCDMCAADQPMVYRRRAAQRARRQLLVQEFCSAEASVRSDVLSEEYVEWLSQEEAFVQAVTALVAPARKARDELLRELLPRVLQGGGELDAAQDSLEGESFTEGRCRFCGASCLVSDTKQAPVCRFPGRDCNRKMLLFCSALLPCGHGCACLSGDVQCTHFCMECSPHPTCPICLESYSESPAVVLSCGHVLHYGCASVQLTRFLDTLQPGKVINPSLATCCVCDDMISASQLSHLTEVAHPAVSSALNTTLDASESLAGKPVDPGAPTTTRPLDLLRHSACTTCTACKKVFCFGKPTDTPPPLCCACAPASEPPALPPA
eukprot:TRINITY_DN2190_c0_g1_i5.p1 TRINITY_DN2190_c0_g1~~TRINITY_DN2190_c0_g1_i5.p1  ORF type:complete len:690 (+),score=149.60 TRINITY_DN2190_c0_g1_i5:276-2345(+)